MCVTTGTAIAIATAAGTATAGIYAAHKQGESADKSGAISQQANQAALDYQKQADAEKLRQFNLQQEQAQKLNDTNQANIAAQFAASEETRLHERAIEDAKNSRRNAGLMKLGSYLGTDLSGSLLPTGEALGSATARTLPTTVGGGSSSSAPSGPPAASGMTGDSAAQQAFAQLVQGLPPTPQSLATLEGPLKQKGITLVRGAQGLTGQIQLPSGRTVAVLPSGAPSASTMPAGVRPFSSLLPQGMA